MDEGASEFGTASIGAVPQLAPKTKRLCQMVPEGFYCDGKPHLPWVLQAPAVKVKHRPRRGGGRHACPLCFITLGPVADVPCTSCCTDSRYSAQVDGTTRGT